MIALVFAVALAQSPCADHAALMSVAADRAAVFPYPTFSIALRQAGDVYRRSAVTPRLKTALRYYFQVFR